jgi:hypothetical protein
MSDSGMLRRVREGAVQTAQHYTLSNVADLYLNDFQELLCERFV